MSPKWIPNDTYFDEQWHLENTGQDNGVAGEDVNITGAWNNYRGTGVVIGIVDDGLEWDHDDLSANYESNLDYDYCNYDEIHTHLIGTLTGPQLLVLQPLLEIMV